MALRNCKECGNPTSSTAAACPKCGAKIERTSGCAIIVGGFFAVVVAMMVVGSISRNNARDASASAEAERVSKLSPARKEEEERQRILKLEDKRKADAGVQRAAIGALTLKKTMRDPDSFRLESALVIDGSGAVCYDYRAKNGFGGTNAGHAVVSGDGKRFKTSDTEGFSALWNKECVGKRGSEVQAIINSAVLK